MAAITGLPNFYGTSAPAAADFNNAAKAILSQLGGVYWDNGMDGYVQAVGNLNASNLAAWAAFKNSQKNEAYSVTEISDTFQASAGAFTYIPSFGPFASDVMVTGAGLMASDGTVYASGGSLGIVINNQPVSLLPVSQGTVANAGTYVADAVWWKVAIPLRAGDMILLDPVPSSYSVWSAVTNLAVSVAARTQGTAPATTTLVPMTLTLHMRAAHVC